jgi:hypothetical protein
MYRTTVAPGEISGHGAVVQMLSPPLSPKAAEDQRNCYSKPLTYSGEMKAQMRPLSKGPSSSVPEMEMVESAEVIGLRLSGALSAYRGLADRIKW